MTNFNDIRLLIVDDEKELLESLKQILEQSGFDITICQNVDKAVNAIKNDYYDLVLTDIEMPVKTGLDFIKILREGLDMSIPIIIMTGRATTEYLAEAIKVGASDFIPKPVNKKALNEIINSQLKKSKRLKLDYDLYHTFQNFKKSFLFQPEEFLNKSIVEYLNTEIKKNFNLSPFKRNEIYLVLEEMITNAFMHGIWSLNKKERQLNKTAQTELINQRNKDNADLTCQAFVHVSFDYIKTENELIITVKDTGQGFDFNKYMKSNFNKLLDPLVPTGRGLFLIKTLSKELVFSDNGSKIQVTISLAHD